MPIVLICDVEMPVMGVSAGVADGLSLGLTKFILYVGKNNPSTGLRE